MDKRRPPPSGKPGADSKKRKDAPTDARPGNNRVSSKRVKFQDARNIRSQPADAALDDGKLDLLKFISAREYEVRALESSMRKCKTVNLTRVFQQVPRAMRRRTASHNVKRVPKKLRERARREQIEDNTPTVEARKRRPRTTRARIRAETIKKLGALAARKKKQWADKALKEGRDDSGKPAAVVARAPRPKIRRNELNEPPKVASKFKKRQINKTWLPTHLWHAKRARMTEPAKPLWRFAVPLTPTEKCYRSTHRSSGQKGAVVWDMSYMSTMGLYGTEEGVGRVLKLLGLTQEGHWGPRGQKWRAGLRKWSGMLSKQKRESRRDIGPATIVWNPEPPPESAGESGSSETPRRQRQLLIRTHPSCFLELFQELVKLCKMQSPQLHVEDLRYEIGSIELTGPGSTEALLAVLKPYYDKPEAEEPQGRILGSLAGVTNPGSLAKDAFLSFSAKDPRLSYPPKKLDVPEEGSPQLLNLLTKWPVEDKLKPYALFDREARHKASQLPSQKSINRRKGSHLPGKAVAVTPADPPIPIMLLASRPTLGGQAQGTWTLLAPWKCILPIWYSLMHCPLSTGGNPRLGGLDEQRQVAFEQGAPWFPADFPATDAGMKWELNEREKRKRDWDRRPKGKRVAWTSLDLGAGRKGEVGDGLACDFEHLFGLPSHIPSTPVSSEQDDDTMEVDPPEEAQDTTANSSPPSFSLAAVNHVTKGTFDKLTACGNLDPPPKTSLLTITLTILGRGVANTCARIYRLPQDPAATAYPSTQTEVPATIPPPDTSNPLPSNLRQQWLAEDPASNTKTRKNPRPPAPPRMPPNADLETRKRLLAASLLTSAPPFPRSAASSRLDVGGHPLCPGEEDLIGFVTTGEYNLREGKSTAVGAVSAEKAVETVRSAGAREGRLCVVRNAGEAVGWLARWEVV